MEAEWGGNHNQPVKLAGENRYLARRPGLRAGELLRALRQPLGACSLHLPGVHLSRGLQAR